jgi:hypothetical protein
MMYDSTTANDIPHDAEMAAGYANGLYENYTAVKMRFPNIPVLGISVNGRLDELAHVLDVEHGDCLPGWFQPWARAMANHGVIRPTCYCSRIAASQVLRDAPRGVTVDLWLADWTGVPHRLSEPGANVVAVQYAAPGHGADGHFDVSAVWDDTWHPG